jgi:O-antigen/teichoic acid export membrane protein
LQIPVFFLSAFFSQTAVGYYAFATSMLQIPTALIGNAIGQVFFQRAAKERAMGKGVGRLLDELYEYMAIIVTFPMLSIALIGPEAFSVALGAYWSEAGVYASIIAPSVLFSFAISSLPLFSVLEKQGHGLAFAIILSLGRAIPTLVGAWAGLGVRTTLALLSGSHSLIWLSASFWFYHKLRVSKWRILSHHSRYFLYSVPSLTIIAVIKWCLATSSRWILLVAVLASAIYLWLVVKRKSRIKSIIKSIFA